MVKSRYELKEEMDLTGSTEVKCSDIKKELGNEWLGNEMKWMKLKQGVRWREDCLDKKKDRLSNKWTNIGQMRKCDSVRKKLIGGADESFQQYKKRSLTNVGVFYEVLVCGNFGKTNAQRTNLLKKGKLGYEVLRLRMKKGRWKCKLEADIRRAWTVYWGFWKLIVKIKGLVIVTIFRETVVG
jgi:hypothetical protein